MINKTLLIQICRKEKFVEFVTAGFHRSNITSKKFNSRDDPARRLLK